MHHFTEEESRRTLYQLLADMRNPREIADFLEVFLSTNATSKLARRVTALQLFDQGLKSEEVKAITKLPTTSIDSMLEAGNTPIGERVLERVSAHSWATQIMQKLSSLFRGDQTQEHRQTL